MPDDPANKKGLHFYRDQLWWGQIRISRARLSVLAMLILIFTFQFRLWAGIGTLIQLATQSVSNAASDPKVNPLAIAKASRT